MHCKGIKIYFTALQTWGVQPMLPWTSGWPGLSGCTPVAPSAVLGHGAFIFIGMFNQPTRARVDKHSWPCVILISVPRCAEAVGHALMFDSMNVQSMHVTFHAWRRRVHWILWQPPCCCVKLGATPTLSRYVIYAPTVSLSWPLSSFSKMSLGVNHGGVAVVAAAGIRASAVDLGVQLTTFECIIAHITSSTSRCLVVVVVYRPGSSAVTANFFTELKDMLNFTALVFATWCYASVAYAIMQCPSACLSVCLSCSCILWKQINMSSNIFSPSGTFSIPNVMAILRRGPS